MARRDPPPSGKPSDLLYRAGNHILHLFLINPVTRDQRAVKRGFEMTLEPEIEMSRRSPWTRLAFCFALASLAASARAETVSLTGTLATPEDTVEEVITLTTPGVVVLQTYGFGGGTNAAGNVISPGGTDPFLGIFSGTGDSASMVTDGFGDPYGTSIDLGNYGSFAGCPPAGMETIGGSPQCGDVDISVGLLAGTYTVLLTDGQYIPDAVFDNGTLGEGFSDFTGGEFCNVDINGVGCPNDSGAWALDITTPGSATPEPGTMLLIGAGLLGLGVCQRRRSAAKNRQTNESTEE
jgi:hypothetical protein